MPGTTPVAKKSTARLVVVRIKGMPVAVMKSTPWIKMEWTKAMIIAVLAIIPLAIWQVLVRMHVNVDMMMGAMKSTVLLAAPLTYSPTWVNGDAAAPPLNGAALHITCPRANCGAIAILWGRSKI
mmetsp:Transcript_21747/g.55501  ORF Transcript_21747/g.55501 Transcript_21747/m.55501 type:complete len:125 (-) Transcript_21747:98-472(-)